MIYEGLSRCLSKKRELSLGYMLLEGAGGDTQKFSLMHWRNFDTGYKVMGFAPSGG
jgi:hypothetical protein